MTTCLPNVLDVVSCVALGDALCIYFLSMQYTRAVTLAQELFVILRMKTRPSLSFFFAKKKRRRKRKRTSIRECSSFIHSKIELFLAHLGSVTYLVENDNKPFLLSTFERFRRKLNCKTSTSCLRLYTSGVPGKGRTLLHVFCNHSDGTFG